MKNKDIKFLEIRYLRGPNIWTYRPVIEAVVDIGELEDFPSNTIPGFYERLTGLLPSLIEHRCSYGERGGFLRRVQEGTWPAHILEHVTLELQNLAGMPGGFGKARETSTRGVYKVVVRAWHDEVTRACLYSGRELLLAAIHETPFDVAAAVAHLTDMAERKLLGPSTSCIVDAATAKDRRIPAIRLLATGNLVQLGYGSRSRRIWTAETDRTSAIAEGISRDKDLTKSLLSSCGVPVPEGRLVDSANDAWEAAEDIGYPVVVKPSDGNHARGVFTNLMSPAEVEAAYAAAVTEGSGVIVERYVCGSEHRLLVIGGKLVAAARGETAKVTGDGESTIDQLIDSQINSDPRRGAEEEYPLDILSLSDNPVARLEVTRQGFSGDSIPPAGREVLIVRSGNHTDDITDSVHPDTAATASLAARIVGLDIAGVDLVCEDISRPLDEQRGAIVEVNAGPGLLMHLKPESGEPRPVGRAIVEQLFPNGDDGRIPVIGVSGSFGKTTVANLVARFLTLSGKHTGLACSDGLFLDRRCIAKGDNATWGAANRILMNRAVDAAVLENGSDTVLDEGLAYDRCLIGVITNVDPARHVGRYHIETPEQVFTVLRTQVDLVLPGGAAVLNAGHPMLVEMAALCDGEVIFFATDPEQPALVNHRALGKRAVFVRGGQVVLASGNDETPIVSLQGIPLTDGGSVDFEIENVLAATAAAWALGIGPELIRTGLETFTVA
ncbi:MAG: Cyanophycin synthetase [Candidatus Accumulibacter regalis]|jgi:cyanophycin synthetase|uniref:Cyanophycin synthetase n=1 Tax=Accumulibacter regalis TaxID=522306 RepID=A0A011QMI7_ACCRE|nr:MAG: Cyanophycin synthetase [Candidatus Accumulibacter regalis]MBL8368732.1 cyanophycin synthetase [Accumulibacter sp.]MBN8515653.1 cyanophycin synthetase [Accumulibacter sp.]